jgi:glycosyltransferase involved in cell wall biosynthesis
MTHVVFVTPNFENNSLGRTYSLWLLAERLGWTSSVVGVKGGRIWEPLLGSSFAEQCFLPGAVHDLREQLRTADVVVAVKPLPSSLGVALRESGPVPVVLDMDDPDIEVRTAWPPLRQRAIYALRRPRWYWQVRSYRKVARRLPLMVSNPELQRMYGGSVIPHVREPLPVEPVRSTTAPVVRFVGSPRGHKGVELLRSAVEALSDDGFTLEVTADRPEDGRAWERWVGTTTLEEGERLVRTADVVAIPSLATDWAGAQLPAKLVDAMISGRAIVASDLPPVRWALGDTGLLVPPGDGVGLKRALQRLADPAVRADLGAAARRRALELFSVDAVAPVFAGVVRDAIAPVQDAAVPS